MSIDWSAPIEAVNEDGRVQAAEYLGDRPDGQFVFCDGEFRTKFHADGSPLYYECGWTIRNVATAARMTDLSPETVERMVALVRWMEEKRGQHADYYTRFGFEAWSRVREIAADLPQPVDPDLLEARAMANEYAPHGGPWAGILEGKHDASPAVTQLLAAIKRGRALATTPASDDRRG